MRGRKAPTTKAKRTVAYIRCSTEDQARNGFTLQGQQSRIESYAIATDRCIDEAVIDKNQSAKSLDRPGMKRLLEGIQTGDIATVIVHKLDRMTRNVRDLGDLLEAFDKAGASLVSVSESLDTSSAAGRMCINMMGTVAQWERETISERTANSLADRRKKGLVYGPVPFGYAREGDKLTANPKYHGALQTIRTMHNKDASLRQIAAALTAQKISPPKGRAWYASSVKAILDSKMMSTG
jgi:DNA invertase Pin-like site-specific DNA recombinase